MKTMDRKRRVFFAINLPDEIREKLVAWQRDHRDLPVRWIKPESLHMTLVFVGSVEEAQLQALRLAAENSTRTHNPFELRFTDIRYGPPPGPMRMIWANLAPSARVVTLTRDLEQEIAACLGEGAFEPETRESHPHITLARMDEMEWRRKIGRAVPDIATAFDASFLATRFELMESHLAKTGAEYEILRPFSLSLPQ